MKTQYSNKNKCYEIQIELTSTFPELLISTGYKCFLKCFGVLMHAILFLNFQIIPLQ
jgi:hypothetical protein